MTPNMRNPAWQGGARGIVQLGGSNSRDNIPTHFDLQRLRVLRRFRFSPELAAVVAGLAYPEGRS
jgi:hypothetical protein